MAGRFTKEELDSLSKYLSPEDTDSPVATPSSAPAAPSRAAANSSSELASDPAMAKYLTGDDKVPSLEMNIPGSDPSNPVQQSPVSFLDRAKLAVGNPAGRISYLKKTGQYEDVKEDEKHGLVVKKDGRWHAVDPKGTGTGDIFSQGSELLKDSVADMGDVALNAAGTAAGTAVGASFGGPAGAVPGALMGGIASGQARVGLGQLAGTYQASPEEQLKDIGWEGLLSMGGHVAGEALLKPTLGAIGSAAGKIKNVVSDTGKEAISWMYGHTTGAGQEAIRSLIEAPGKVTSSIGTYLKNAAGDTKTAVANATDDAIGATKQLLERATQALPQKYGQMLDALMTHPNAAKMKVDMGEVFQNGAKALEEAGYGRIVPESAEATGTTSSTIRKVYDEKGRLVRTIEINKTGNKELTEEGLNISGNKEKLSTTNRGTAVENTTSDKTDGFIKLGDGFVFKPFTPAELAERAKNGQAIEVVNKDTHAAVQEMATMLGNFSKIGTVEGPQATRILTRYNQLVNSIATDARSGENPAFQRLMDRMASGFKEGVGAQFEKAGLSKEYTGLSQIYEQHGQAVAQARSILNSPTGQGAEQLAKRIATESPTKYRTQQGLVRNLVQLTGEEGQQLADKVSHLHAVAALTPKLPSKLNLTQMGAAAAAGKFATAGLGLVAAPNFSPRAVAYGLGAASGAAGMASAAAKTVPYAGMMNQFLQSLSTSQMRDLLTNDQALTHLFTHTVMAPHQEDAQKQQLLQGALDGGQ